MKLPEIRLNAEIIKALTGLLNSRIGLLLVVCLLVAPSLGEIKQDIREIKTIATSVKEQHSKTPELLAMIEKKIIELYAYCTDTTGGGG
jgi:hypothetical protein